jgi:hypothetical protein
MVLAAVGVYIMFSAILKTVSGIDICIPCIWKSILGFNCPGCGLTTALISLMELNFNHAFEANWLIFIIIPYGIYYLKQDYISFQRNHRA